MIVLQYSSCQNKVKDPNCKLTAFHVIQANFSKVNLLPQYWQNGITEVREKLLTLNCNILKAIDVESLNLVRMYLELFPAFCSRLKKLIRMLF